MLGPVCSPCALGTPPHYAQLRSVAYSVQTVQSVRLCVAVCVATAHTTRAQVCPTRCISLSQERLRLVNEVLCVPLCSSSLTFARLMLQVILSNSSERSRGAVVANPTPQATPAAESGHRDGGSGSRTEWAFSVQQRTESGTRAHGRIDDASNSHCHRTGPLQNRGPPPVGRARPGEQPADSVLLPPELKGRGRRPARGRCAAHGETGVCWCLHA